MGSLISKSIRSFSYFIIIFVLAFGVVVIKPTLIAKAGDPVEPTPISSCAGLQAISADINNLTESYIQTANINCAGVDFTPIGDSSVPFTGTYDGANFEITDLTINSDSSMIGLFGKLGTDGTLGTVQNVKLVNANVTSEAGFTTVGALVGMNRGTVTDSSSTGTVSSGSHHTGGLVGYNTSDGTITGSHSSADVIGTGNYTGGLTGQNNGAISGSYATGNVTGSRYVGGLVGENTNDWGGPGTIGTSYATGNVTGSDHYIGGLVGYTYGTINEVYATGSVTGADGTDETHYSYHVGGLIGGSSSGFSITGVHATGNVSGYQYVGGLIGSSSITISNSYASGEIIATIGAAGGLVGYNNNDISDSHATGSVTGGFQVGGLVGYNSSSDISGSYATGNVTGGDDPTGGYGGLVGINSVDSIMDSFATGKVNGSNSVGGLVGINKSGGVIVRSYAIGNVTGTAKWIGGFVGGNTANSTITDAYAKGSATGTVGVGGFAGLNVGTLTNTYSVGVITGTSNTGGLVGMGATGKNTGTVNLSFYNSTITGLSDTGKGEPKNTTQMKLQSTYQPGEGDWNFSTPDGIWAIDASNNNGYPYFQWQDFSGPTFEELSAGDTRVININEGQTITTNPYTIYVKPTDGAGITKVDFYIDNVLICTDTTADVNGYYSCEWDTSKYHSDVKIIAYDALGNSSTLTRSTTVSLTGVPNTGLQSETYVVPAVIGFVGLILLALSLKRQLHEKKR